MLISFLFLSKNICCGYSLEAPRRGASNEYPQHMFSSRNKKNIMWIPPLICSYGISLESSASNLFEVPCCIFLAEMHCSEAGWRQNLTIWHTCTILKKRKRKKERPEAHRFVSNYNILPSCTWWQSFYYVGEIYKWYAWKNNKYFHYCMYLTFWSDPWGGQVVWRCSVSYVTGASNWYWLTVGQGLLSL